MNYEEYLKNNPEFAQQMAAKEAPGGKSGRYKCAACGVDLPHDVLRHSFASYGYHYLGAEKTVEILGHVGGFGVFAKHYKGLATPAQAKRYFEIAPKAAK